ncbi:hypothetical protein [Mesorhizobium escarrei]|uniref:MarR family transcriptional regulator n=1 Tax=Mesorhizobium escarrei TaxID=666018 RepID=A0ABM9EJ93_9HYPH|nr:hypothetical protein [Mesorhizobium escarrei]CAH2409469.1 conserved hypothetical protein [Mesorhizobium escarrei]
MLGTEQITSEVSFAEALQRYLGDTLHDRIPVMEFADTGSLPSFLARTYTLYEAWIAGRRCVFLAALNNAATPSDIVKHISLIRNSVDAIVVFATSSLSAHNRSRLVGQGVPFVVPGNQLYIPDLAMDLREHFRGLKQRHSDGLLPAAQAVLFDHLLRNDETATTPSFIAARIRYSAMSIGRAFDDLVASGLARTEKHGKERHIRFKAEGRHLLQAARDLLRSPVRSVKFVQGDHFRTMLKQAGETALAELTDLSRPSVGIFAVAASDWKAIAQASGFVETSRDQADFVIETWSYDPAALSDTNTVDPLSLYAQFRDHRDERVSMAAEQLLENIPW